MHKKIIMLSFLLILINTHIAFSQQDGGIPGGGLGGELWDWEGLIPF